MAKAKVVVQKKEPVVALMSGVSIARLLAIGALVGLVTLALYLVLDKYVFTPILCSEIAGAGRCENKQYFASTLAMILGGGAGVMALVRLRAFRPLLVVILVTVSLWNVLVVAGVMGGWAVALWAMVLFALAYAVFAWLVQIRNFVVALIASIVLVVVVRLILVA